MEPSLDADTVDGIDSLVLMSTTLECVTQECSVWTSSGGCPIACQSGYTVMGCGARSSSPYAMTENRFSGNGCHCAIWNYNIATTYCQARCCRLV